MSGDTVHVKGLSALNDFLQQLPVKIERNVLRGSLRAGMNVIKPFAQAGVHSISGVLAKGLKVSTDGKGGRATAHLKVTGKHAFIGHMLEFTGAAAHWIKPKDANALVIGGNVLSTVYHPGFHPHPFLRPALDGQAGPAVVAAAEYMKSRLATKEGLDTSDVEIEEA